MEPNEPDDPDDVIGEVEINFQPRTEVLSQHGISGDDFEIALMKVLDARLELAESGDTGEDDLPNLEDVEIVIDGRSFRLGDLTEIVIEGDLD